MNKKYKIVLVLLIVIVAISSYFIIKEFAENKKETDIYEDLQEIVVEQNDEDTNINENKQKSNTNTNGIFFITKYYNSDFCSYRYWRYEPFIWRKRITRIIGN